MIEILEYQFSFAFSYLHQSKGLDNLSCGMLTQYSAAPSQSQRQETLDQWITRGACDSTLIVLVPGHFDVSFETPAVAPTVFDEPIVGAVLFSAVSDDQDAVVEFGARAIGLVVHAFGIKLETLLRRIDRNGDWSDGRDCGFQFFLVTFRDIDVANVLGTAVSGIVSAPRENVFLSIISLTQSEKIVGNNCTTVCRLIGKAKTQEFRKSFAMNSLFRKL